MVPSGPPGLTEPWLVLSVGFYDPVVLESLESENGLGWRGKKASLTTLCLRALRDCGAPLGAVQLQGQDNKGSSGLPSTP